jgi:pilus assembly protein CpaE
MRSLLIVLSQSEREPWAQELITAAQPDNPLILVSSLQDAATHIAQHGFSPSHVVFDIGQRGTDVLPEIDALAQQCEPGTRVMAIGDTNDIRLYRDVIARGVIDYIPMPASIDAVVKALTSVAMPSTASTGKGEKRVIVFMSAASGDGASTVALNTAFAISQLANGRTVLVDMDYQFGMIAKNLALQNQYGIRDLFDHPERGVDTTLLNRMVASYQKLHVITAPSELRYLPAVNATVIHDLIDALKENYDTIIIDLPHVWLPWVATAAQQSTHLVLVAQLWLKSVSHAARMMRAFRDIGVTAERVTAVINRSGAKFKEAIDAKDFERVCGTSIRHRISNDIKTIVAAEAAATTIMELQPTALSGDIQKLARTMMGMSAEASATPEKRTGLFSKLKG